MTPITPAENLRRSTRVESVHPDVLPHALDELAERVAEVRPRLVDGWETTALIESLGFTDRRVQREFGLDDARAAGDEVYARLKGRRGPVDRWEPPETDGPLAIVVRSAASTLIYAIPWLAVFGAQILRPNAMRVPSQVAPALALALMFSLVVSGGFVQAIVRRGGFYVSLGQVEMAHQIIRALLRIGIAATVIVALGAMAVGWYFELFTWSSLVLGADAFVVMSVLWMVCGTFAIRQQQWRVAAAFLVGFAAFTGIRSAGADVISAQLLAVAVVLVVAAVQIRYVLGRRPGASALPAGVLLPRFSVLAYLTVPYFGYGTVYFAFLFADRLTAGTAVASLVGGPFDIPAQYNFGMELALLTLLLAASGVEVAGALFARALRNEAARPLTAGACGLVDAVRRHHWRAIGLTLATFLATAVLVGASAGRLLPDAWTPQSVSTLVVGDLGYACLAVALLNSLVLFEVARPWTVVREFAVALLINLSAGYVLGHLFGGFHAVDGLIVGAAYFSARSTLAVGQALDHPDYAYAVA